MMVVTCIFVSIVATCVCSGHRLIKVIEWVWGVEKARLASFRGMSEARFLYAHGYMCILLQEPKSKPVRYSLRLDQRNPLYSHDPWISISWRALCYSSGCKLIKHIGRRKHPIGLLMDRAYEGDETRRTGAES